MAKTNTAVKQPKAQPTNDTNNSDAKKQAQSVEFTEAGQTQAVGPGSSIDILLDMNVPVTVSIGQTEMPVRRLLQLGPGSVLKLDKSIDEPADLFLKDAKFATGKVVVIDGLFAVKIKQILGTGAAAEPTEA